MRMGQAISSVFKKYFVFSGRARRSEYWLFVLFNILMLIAIALAGALLGGIENSSQRTVSSIIDIYMLIIWFPTFTVQVRRAHDIGKPGVLIIVFNILSAGTWIGDFFSISLIRDPDVLLATDIIRVGLALVVFIMMLISGNEGPNEYGPDPKAEENESNDMKSIPVSEQPATNEIRFCRECGKPLEKGSVFCRYCGKKLI